MSAIDRDELLRLECLFLGAQLEIGQDNVIGQGEGHQEGSAVSRLTCLAMPSFAPVNLFAATPCWWPPPWVQTAAKKRAASSANTSGNWK